ncbi:hypothetical protein KSS87_009804 [Heliosperma pusillum]|nr:hypothetical protein KSS87_009804 [Heliosperma pusillum]
MVRQPHTTTTSSSTTTTFLLTPPKRKKGRPSLHDLQQRKLFQQQQQQHNSRNNNNNNKNNEDDDHFNNNKNPQFNPNSNSINSNSNSNSQPRRIRSSRNTSILPAQFLLGSDSDSDSPQHLKSNSNSASDSDSDDERVSKKIRRLSTNSKNSKDEKRSKATDTQNETRVVLGGPTNASTSAAAASATALPDRKLLLLVIDRLQKKDTRGVFAEPVDPEELPDYHEVIETPMDFGTVRSNLDRGRYKTLEQFEVSDVLRASDYAVSGAAYCVLEFNLLCNRNAFCSLFLESLVSDLLYPDTLKFFEMYKIKDDVYLISSNAMQYNPPSTIFFRQARSIQELAKKEFETLRQDAGLSDPPPKPRRGRPPGSRNLKKLLEKSPADHSVAESAPDPAPTPTPVSREDDATRSGSYNLRKGPSLYRFPRKLENSFDFSASSSRYMSTKYGKMPCVLEENRRDTYYSSQFDSDQDCLAAAFGSSDRQLIAVSTIVYIFFYARSLARFGADLGPVVWSVVSKKLRSILPPNVDFGPGWVEETKALSTQLSPLPDKLVQSSSLLQDTFNNRPHSPLPSGFTKSTFVPKISASCSENYAGAGELSYNGEWSSLNGINGVIPSGSTSRPTSSSFFNTAMVSSAFENSTSVARSSLHSPPVDYHGMMNPETDISVYGTPYWNNMPIQERCDRLHPAEVNGGFQASSSKNSGLSIGSPPQLDLVLQL